MTDSRERIEDLLIREALGELSSAEAQEVEALLSAHPEVDRNEFSPVVGTVFLAASHPQAAAMPADLYSKIFADAAEVLETPE